MKRRIVITFIIMFMIFFICVQANYLDVSSSSSSVTVGDTVKITLALDSLEGKFKISSSDSSILSGDKTTDWLEGGSFSTYFTAKKAGSVQIVVTPINATTMDPNNEKDFYETRSINITVVNKSTPQQIDVNRTYNKNNYLKSLSVSGYNIDFDKDTLEYNINLEPGTEKINITAVVEDNTATVKGTGEVDVSEGINTINIIVTAENGNERIYKIIASVEEKDPIEVLIDKKKYRVVKKENLISDREGYKRTTVKINKFDIPALYNEITKVTLVGLKDEEGNIKYYSYNTKNGEYKAYNEFVFDLMNLYIHEKKNSKYSKTNIKINDREVIAYKLDGINDYYLIYATNTSTGHEGYYLYDTKENSVQRYDTALLESLTKEKDKYLNVVIVLSCVCFLCMLFLLVEINRDSKRKNEE